MVTSHKQTTYECAKDVIQYASKEYASGRGHLAANVGNRPQSIEVEAQSPSDRI